MAEVRWTLTAAEDLRILEETIARDSPLNAVQFVDRLVASVDKLLEMPQIGRMVPEFNRETLREVIFRNYRVVYTTDKPDVTILRVVHGARDLSAMEKREPWTLE